MRYLITLLFVFRALAAAPDPLASQVTIYRDDYGVPHVVGETEEAAFFGYGYAQAQDHLERMMLQYRDAQGRRAEVQGFEALGDGYLHFIPYEYRWDGDYLQRLLRTKKGVVENHGKIERPVYAILDGFARGVNAYIRENRARIPKWIDEITAEDVEALERSQYFRFYSIHDALIKLPGPTYDLPRLGSNQWAIVPGKSADGRVIHVEHTHMPWANRFQNYEGHLIVPGKLNTAGISWFGSPVFLDGFNDRITWSATYNEPNIADVYEEKLNPDNPLQYLYDGAWREMRVEQEPFRVKGANSIETVTLPLYYTHHGPVVKVDRSARRAWSVRLPNFENVTYTAALFGLMKARDLEQFKTVVRRQWMPRWNLLYSDARDIYWVHNGNVAQRPDGYDWRKPVPGWISATEWGAYLPFESYPQILNPASGFLQNCNNPPWVVTRNSGLKPLDPAPYYLRSQPRADAGEEALNTRGERIFQVLSQNRKFSVQEMIDLGFDTYVLAAEVVVPLLERAYKAAPPSDSRVRRSVDLLTAWDRRSSKDSAAYTYMHFWGKAYQDLFTGAKFSQFNSFERNRIDLASAEEQKMARAALEEAISRIEKRYGRSEVPWGEINFVVRGGKFPLGGTEMYGVLHPDEGPEQENGEIHCDDGWGHLMVVVEGQPKEIWTLLPYGQSEDPSSQHYNDQAKLHSRRQAKRFRFTASEILANTKSVWGDPERLKRLAAEEGR
jgi:acyl-homoserine-lactone acylase